MFKPWAVVHRRSDVTCADFYLHTKKKPASVFKWLAVKSEIRGDHFVAAVRLTRRCFSLPPENYSAACIERQVNLPQQLEETDYATIKDGVNFDGSNPSSAEARGASLTPADDAVVR